MDWRDQASAWLSSLVPYVSIFGASILGRLMYLAGLCRRGDRRFWSWSLLWEIPVAFGMGLIGAGVAEYLDLGQMGALGTIAVASYLGPRGAEATLERFLDRRST
ncbi:phage holin family protein [Nisaea sediminum]|uniref:phage holin family protein n=1 Tax=Nisaea sediminum TaxID=2775867 RepID=UPI001867C76F|nr:phage holin family protein [Nisaea sediminum]